MNLLAEGNVLLEDDANGPDKKAMGWLMRLRGVKDAKDEYPN